MLRIVEEHPCHVAAREALLDAAFGLDRQAKASERLREGRLPANHLALAALDGEILVGTLRFWHVATGDGRPALMLGPLAVADSHRTRGLGSLMMRRGLTLAGSLGHAAVLLVGDEAYYRRFGFCRALAAELDLPGWYDSSRFLGLELQPGALEGAQGLVSATGAFDEAATDRAMTAGELAAAEPRA